MNGKYLLGGVLTAIAGGLIALAVYTSVVEKKTQVIVAEDSIAVGAAEQARANAFFASLQSESGQIDFTYAAEQTVHAVVHVYTKSLRTTQAYNPIYEWFYGEQYNRPQEVEGFGSGVIITSDGYIITNNHVIEKASEIQVKLNDNRVFDAEVVGADPNTDLAVLKIDASNLEYLRYGDSESLKVGQWVLAVGNPFNLTSTVTAGIVSAKGRSLDLLPKDYKIESFIQTDAALNPGNSGGALVDTKGLLVGITSAIYSPNGAYAGNSFAIPVTIVKKVVDDLIEFGEVQRALLGVSISEVTQDDVEKFDLPEAKGARIGGITQSGAAESSELKINDVIVKVNGIPVATVTELQEQIGKYRPGDRVSIAYFRDGRERTTQITLKNISGTTEVVKPGMGVSTVMGARMETLLPEELKRYKLDNGVKITSVGEGRFQELGIKEGTILVTVNGEKVRNAEDVRRITENGNKMSSIEGVQPNGTYFSFRLSK